MTAKTIWCTLKSFLTGEVVYKTIFKERARALARRYLPDAVHLFAGTAFGSDSEAALHTRTLCAKEIVEIAGVIPQATSAPPQPPPYERASDSGEPD